MPDVTTRVEWDRYDTAIVTVAAIATIFVHPVRTMLKHPFWFDEAWVAALTRAPLTRLPHLSSSAPFGFVALLKLVPGSGLQRGRLVVLGFSALDGRGRLCVHAHAGLATAIERPLRRDRRRRSRSCWPRSRSFATI